MKRPRIIIIDDSPVNLQIMMHTLVVDYNITPFVSSAEGINYVEKNHDVDLILLDIDMPGQNGYEVFTAIKKIPAMSDVPVIFITDRTDVESEISAFDLGIVDYIRKPIIPALAKKRIAFQIKVRRREKNILRESDSIKKLTEVTIKTLTSLVDKFNEDSDRHINRTMAYVTVLSEKMVEKGINLDLIDPVFIENLRLSAPFHDCGKVYVSENILMKPSKLTEKEYEEVKKHTILGSEIMRHARELMGEPSFYDIAEKLVLNYHEKWDGSGYPLQLSGEEIPICARIMAFADIYDALVSKRPYKEAYSHEKAVDIIMQQKAITFDPVIAEIFYEASDDFKSIALNM